MLTTPETTPKPPPVQILPAPAGAPPGDGDRPRRDPLAVLAAPAFELVTIARRLAS